MRTGLGVVSTNYVTNQIKMKLNEGLLNEFGDKYIEEVVVHEFAHVAVKGVYPNQRVKPHGREFKSVCSRIGYPHVSGATTGSFAKSKHIDKIQKANKRVTFTYACGCDTHEMSSIRHNKILRGSSYTCRSCKQTLKKV